MIKVRETTGGITQTTAWANSYAAGSRGGVLAIPGDTYDDTYWTGAFWALTPSMRNLVDSGGRFPVASVNQGTDWGNSTVQSRVTQLKTNAQTALFAGGKVHLLGISAGGTTCLNWAKANPTLVKSIALLIPCVDIQDIYDNDRSGFQSEISAAYSGRPSNANTPAQNTASFTGFPMKIWYSETDTVTPLNVTSSFISGTGATGVSMGSIGHLWGDPFSGQALSQFFAAND